MSKKKIFILVFILATLGALVGVFSGDFNSSKLRNITWDESSIRDEDNRIIISNEDILSSIKVSEEAEFGVGGSITGAKLSPDGFWVAFSIAGAVHDSGWLYNSGTGDISPVAFQYGGGVSVLEWSPDSDLIAFDIETPAPVKFIRVVDVDNIGEFPSDTGTRLQLPLEAELTPPFFYEFLGWQDSRTICFSLEEEQECLKI